jgi:hypothetical protein
MRHQLVRSTIGQKQSVVGCAPIKVQIAGSGGEAESSEIYNDGIPVLIKRSSGSAVTYLQVKSEAVGKHPVVEYWVFLYRLIVYTKVTCQSLRSP